MRPVPGEVYRFHSERARKPKLHLCISEKPIFLFVSSNRRRSGRPYPGDFVLEKADIPFLKPTEYGKSFISCSYMLEGSVHGLSTAERRACGTLRPKIMRSLVTFIEQLEMLSDAKRERLLEDLYDVYAEAA